MKNVNVGFILACALLLIWSCTVAYYAGKADVEITVKHNLNNICEYNKLVRDEFTIDCMAFTNASLKRLTGG